MTAVLTVLLLISIVACGWLTALARRLRRELQESTQVFRTLVTNAPVGVVQTDRSGRNI
jgi:PAS domain-containing protein